MYQHLARLNQAAIQRPWLTCGAWLVASAVIGSSMSDIKVDASYRSFFDPDNELVLALDRIEARYDTGDTLLFLVKTDSGDLFTREGLGAIEELTNASWKLPKSLRVDSLRNFPFSRSQGDDLLVADLYKDAATLGPEALARVRQDALGEDLLVNRLVTPDGRASLVVVSFTEAVGLSLATSRDIYHRALELRDTLRERHPGLGIHVSGVVGGSAAGADTAVADGGLLIPLGLLFALLAIASYLLYESRHLPTAVYGTLACLAVIAVSVVVPMGIMGKLRIAANNITVLIPVIILTLAVADSLHILITYYQRLVRGEANPVALRESLRINAEPVWLTSATTMLGFLVMNASDSPPFRTMGNLVALGVLVAWLAANTLLPAIMSLMPVRVATKKGGVFDPMPDLAAWVVRRHRGILATGVTVAVLSIACIPLNRMNDSWTTYLTERTEFGADTAELLESFEDFNHIEFEVDSGRLDGIYEMDYLRQLSAFTAWLRAQPEVRYVQAMDLVLMRLNRNMHGDDPAWERMPETPSEAAQYLLLYEMSLPYGGSLTNQMTHDKSALRLLVGLNHSESADHLAFRERAEAWQRANLSMQHPGTSTTTIMADISRRDSEAMLLGTALALLVISLSVGLAFRSVKYGLMSFVVNVMPATMALGLWGLFVGQVGISVSMVFAASLGIIVDYCLHFLSKYRRAKQEQGLSAAGAIHYAFSTVGIALLVTTAVLGVNFAILGFSNFRINIDMGVLTAMTIVFALLAQLFYLPAMLLAAERWRERNEP